MISELYFVLPAVDLREVHVLAVVIVVPRLLPQRGVQDLGRDHLGIAVAPVELAQASDVRRPPCQIRGCLLEREVSVDRRELAGQVELVQVGYLTHYLTIGDIEKSQSALQRVSTVVDEFEREASQALGVAHAIGVSSGTDALLEALMALDVGRGDEVVLPTFTFFATASAVTRLGAKPVWVDIDPITYNIDPDLIEAAVTPATRAIIPVHLFGQCAEMDPIRHVANRHGLTVIEDAAQAIGAKDRGRPAGSMGAQTHGDRGRSK